MSKAMIGRLILEASTGMHGEESKILADTWVDMAQQRTELLHALKVLYSNFKSQHYHLLFLGAPDFVEMDKIAKAAIAKAEAAE